MQSIELFEKMFEQQQNADEAHRKWYSQPEWYCAKAYRSTRKTGSETLIFKDPFGSNQLQEIFSILTEQGISEVILGAKDPDLLLHLWELQKLGWWLKQMCLVPVSPFEATHNLSSPAVVLTFSPNRAADAVPDSRQESGQVIHITAIDLISSAILERLRKGKRSWISMPALEKYAQEVKRWWEKKGYTDVRPQISEDDIDEVLSHYPEYFERFQVRTESGEDKVYIARKDGVSELELRNRFCAALPIVYLTALSESWQNLKS